jgi:hypothetical protein
MQLSLLGTSLTIFIVELVSCIKIIYEWPYLHLHYYGIGDFPSVAIV